jgi:isopenicillin N synthase-like dioxygenase
MAHSDTQDSTIPVIDISNPSDEVARQVFEAASTHGFLFIKNDGVTIPPKDIDEMFNLVCTHTAFYPLHTHTSQSKEFFSSPEDHKSEYAIHSDKAGGINRGWVKMAGESLDPEGQKVSPTQVTQSVGLGPNSLQTATSATKLTTL